MFEVSSSKNERGDRFLVVLSFRLRLPLIKGPLSAEIGYA